MSASSSPARALAAAAAAKAAVSAAATNFGKQLTTMGKKAQLKTQKPQKNASRSKAAGQITSFFHEVGKKRQTPPQSPAQSPKAKKALFTAAEGNEASSSSSQQAGLQEEEDVFYQGVLQTYKQHPVVCSLIFLLLPISTAEVERGFSVQNLIKTKFRGSMTIAVLDPLMRIKLNGPRVITASPVLSVALGAQR